MTSSTAHRLRTIFGLSLVLILLLTPASALAQDGGPSQGAGTGFYYVVRPGDTWSGIAATVGLSVATIKKYNPGAIHPYDYLWIGDRLWIPAPEPTHVTSGYWYSVKQGQDWNSVSRATGVPVAALKAANPIAAADPHGWLYIGQKLWIPTGPPAAASAPSAAETTSGGAEATGVIVVPEATAAAPETALGSAATGQPSEAAPATPVPAVAAPAASPTEAPAMAVVGTPTPLSGPEPTPEPLIPVESTAVPTEVPVASPTTAAGVAPAATETPIASAGAQPTPAGASTTTPGVTVPSVAGCPADPAAYPEAIALQLNGQNFEFKALKAWLESCNLITAETGEVAELVVPGESDKTVTVVIRTSPEDQEPTDQLLVYRRTASGYALAHRVDGAGEITLLKSEDINADGKPDLVYVDRSCGAHTCFTTLFVESWSGSAFQDWIKGEPTMADGKYSLEDTVTAGQGEEILVHGGIINSAGAGPQRAWTETYVSPEGGPYESYKKAYDESSCLYFQVQDANTLFDQWSDIGFAPAISAYDKAITDKSTKACGKDPKEVTQLTDFSRFRLIVSWVSRGQLNKAIQIRSEMTYQPLIGAADAFLTGLKNSGSIVQACRDTTRYAEANPASWDYLTDWGYANPTFTASDLCPLG